MGEHRGSIRELKAIIREPKASMGAKRALARERSGEPLVSDGPRLALGSGILYIYYIPHTPELRFMNYSINSGKGARLLWREYCRAMILRDRR